MNFFSFILIFIAGVSSGFLFFKNRLKNWSNLLEKKLDEINTEDLKNNIHSPLDKGDKIPVELHPVVEKVKSILQKFKTEPEENEIEPEIDSTESPEKLKTTIDNLKIVNELGRKVTSSLNLEQSFQYLYTTINSMMDAAVIELIVYNNLPDKRKVFSNIQYPADTKNNSYSNPMAEWSFKNNREVFLADAENDFARYVFEPLKLPDDSIAKSVLVFPVLFRNTVAGTLCIISFQKNSLNEYHQEIIRLLLGYIAVAMENAITHEELNLTKIRAEQSELFKEQFLANMSHEIRTPINAVTGMTRLLLDKNPREDQLRYLESIRNASDSLLVIINDILDLSKIEAGKVELEKIDFSIHNLIKNVKEIMQFKAEEKGLILNDKTDSEIPPVLIGDPMRLTQILINLVSNAIKFTSKGTVSMNVKISNDGNNYSLIKNEFKLNSIIRFEVSDTGIGMTEDQLSKLFQNYSQASSDTARTYGGTGLGLSISRQLVDLQGGTISVQSKPGEGSTFSFTLSFPVSKNKTVAVNEKSISNEMYKELKGIKILLADDNEYNRIVVKETLHLKIDDITIDEALDGAEVLYKVKNNDYDIILMDLVMPQLNGLDATKIIRNELPSPKNQIPIVALTASVVKSEIDKCYAAGMNGFIPKPFKSYDLFFAIYKALNLESENILKEIIADGSPHKQNGKYIDLNHLFEFTEGDQVRMQRYIDLFIVKTPQHLEILKTALTKKDFEQIRITSHSMKSMLQSAGSLNGLEVAELIEQACRENIMLDQLPGLIEKLSEICTKAISELKTIAF